VEDILVSEEEHTDWIETQLDLIVRIGLQSYLSEQLGAG
jgi:bacterioferritin